MVAVQCYLAIIPEKLNIQLKQNTHNCYRVGPTHCPTNSRQDTSDERRTEQNGRFLFPLEYDIPLHHHHPADVLFGLSVDLCLPQLLLSSDTAAKSRGNPRSDQDGLSGSHGGTTFQCLAGFRLKTLPKLGLNLTVH